MKSFALVAAVCAAASMSASAEECVLKNLGKELEPITAMVYACYDATGYAVIPPRANPTPEQTAAVCTKCSEMIAKAKTMTFATCTFKVSGVSIPLNEWVPKITGACATDTGAAASNSSSSSNSTATAGTSTTVGEPSNSTVSSSGSAKNASANTTKNASTAPTPTPTGSANAVTSLSIAAVAVGSLAASLLL